jgi:hypothetical protein
MLYPILIAEYTDCMDAKNLAELLCATTHQPLLQGICTYENLSFSHAMYNFHFSTAVSFKFDETSKFVRKRYIIGTLSCDSLYALKHDESQHWMVDTLREVGTPCDIHLFVQCPSLKHLNFDARVSEHVRWSDDDNFMKFAEFFHQIDADWLPICSI